MIVLGIDAGGTKTVCQVADGSGKVVAESRGPGANLVSLGEQRVEAALRSVIDPALADRPDRVDAVCLGSAPDAFDGVHRKGDYLADGAGAWGKPFMRAYVGGGTGVFTPIQGWYTVASGMADVVLCVAEEKMSSCRPHPQGAFVTIFDNVIERNVHLVTLDDVSLPRVCSFARAHHKSLALVLRASRTESEAWFESPRGLSLADAGGALSPEASMLLRSALETLHREGGVHGSVDREHVYVSGTEVTLAYPREPRLDATREDDLAALDELTAGG